MAFDPSTAKLESGGFDPSTARLDESTPFQRGAATAIERLNAFRSGVTERFIPSILSMPGQFAQNVLNLGSAAAGVAANELGRPDLMPPAQWRVPGNFEDALKGVRAMGLTVSNPDPTDPANKGAEIAGGIVPSIVTPGASLSGIAAATAGAVAGNRLGAEQGELVGSMLPWAANAAFAATRPTRTPTVQEQTAAAARVEGLKIPPVETNPNPINQILQGLSGKARTEMVGSYRNVEKVDAIARRELGMADGAPLTDAAMKSIRDQAGQAYQAVKDFGSKYNLQLKPDGRFRNDLQNLGGDYQAIAAKFPEIAKNESAVLVRDSLSGKNFTPTEIVELTKKLREDAKHNYKAVQNTELHELADVQKRAATALEGLLERTLARSGQQQLLNDFRDARTLIAKTHDVEAAIVEGGGHINPRVLSRAIQNDKYLTGGLKTIGEAANAFPNALRPPNPANAQQFSLWDWFAGSALGGGAAGVTGNPRMAAIGLAVPAARIAAREALLSPLYQRTLGNPHFTTTPDSALAALLRGQLSAPMTQPEPTSSLLDVLQQRPSPSVVATPGIRG